MDSELVENHHKIDSLVSDVSLHSPLSLVIQEITSWRPVSTQSAMIQAGQVTLMDDSSRGRAKKAFADCLTNTGELNTIKKARLPRPNESEDENYSEVFLSHARVWVFANMYQVQPLKRLAIEELHAVLAVFHLYEQRCSDVVALLRYLYAEHPPSCSEEGSKESRWRLMQYYMAVEMETLVKNEDFQSLIIEDGGPLLRDVMMVVARRLA